MGQEKVEQDYQDNAEAGKTVQNVSGRRLGALLQCKVREKKKSQREQRGGGLDEHGHSQGQAEGEHQDGSASAHSEKQEGVADDEEHGHHFFAFDRHESEIDAMEDGEEHAGG